MATATRDSTLQWLGAASVLGDGALAVAAEQARADREVTIASNQHAGSVSTGRQSEVDFIRALPRRCRTAARSRRRLNRPMLV